MALEAKPYVQAAFDKSERRYLLKAGLLIAALYFLRGAIYALSGYFLLFLPVFLFCYVWFKSMHTGDRVLDILKENITFIPIAYAQRGEKLFIPWATITLVLLNVLAFLLVGPSIQDWSVFIKRNFVFLPVNLTWWNVIVSPITSMFLHADAGHLWGNMIFLWAFGPAVEERLRWKKYVFLYLLTGVLGGLIWIFIRATFLKQLTHMLGASGAISGIMGVFMVRCYFKKLIVPLPLFGLIYAKIKVNSLLPLGLFFLMDLKSGFRQLAGSHSRTAYWVHVGSMVAGMLLSAHLKLHRDAAGEKYTESGLQSLDNTFSRREGVTSLQGALQLNPENEKALLGLAREYAITRKPEGRDLFQRAIRLKLRSSPVQATELYKEYLNSYNRMLDPDLQYRLAAAFYQQGDHEPAARALEMIILEPSSADDTRQRAFYQLIVLLAENDMLEAAHYRLRQFTEQFPKSELVKAAEDKFVEVLKS
jgi:membrane associated rhomboid family serine protease